MNLLIKYATRGRKELFHQTIQNIYDTISMKKYHIIISADFDDEALQSIPDYPNTSIHYGPHVSKVNAINRDMEGVKFDWLVNMSDDMRFVKKGWDLEMINRIQSVWGRSTDFFAHFNDGFVRDKLPTMSIMGWDYYQRDKYIYHPDYNSVSCDAEAMFVAMMRGKHHYFPEVLFKHMHCSHIGIKTDQTYRYNDRFDAGDTETYFKRMAKGFDVKNPVMIPDEVRRAMKV